MALILSLETSTSVCSVALSKDSEIIALQERNEVNVHNRLLNVFVEDCLKMGGVSLKQLDAIAVSMGPGSYTGLRIGVSAAKGFCYALDKPLIAVNTLQSMALGFIERNPNIEQTALLCPMIDARRMEVFNAFFNTNIDFVRGTQADIIDEHSYVAFLEKHPVYFFGDGADKCKLALSNNSNANFSIESLPSAAYVSKLAYKSFLKKEFVDVAYFEPYYLKDFVTTTPKNPVNTLNVQD